MVRIFPDCLADTWSRVDQAPVTVLRDRDGGFLCEVIRADISALLEAGYIMPERFQVTATDGETPLYGILIRPAGMEEGKTYPFIDYIYGGMRSPMFPRPSPGKPPTDGRASAACRSTLSWALPELSSMAWAHPAGAGRSTMSAMRTSMAVPVWQTMWGLSVSSRHSSPSWIWTGQASGATPAAAVPLPSAMLEHPGVYKVGVASAGNHDQRMYENTWTERYYGLYNRETYLKGDNTALAPNLEGKLLLACGMLDDNVPMPRPCA